MRRYYVYTRVSTLGKQAENTSQHVQLAACKAYGEENGLIFVDWIHDSQSAVDWENRKGITELKSVAESGEITDVIFYKIDRTGRDGEVKELIRFLYDKNVKVSISHKGRSYETAYACIQDNFWELAVSEYERNTIIERTMSGKVYQFQNGGVIKRPIAGYDTKKVLRNVNGKQIRVTHAVINPAKAAAIRRLFQVFNDTQSEGATVRAMNLEFPDLIQQRETLRRNLKSILSNAMSYAGLPVTESFNGHTREFRYDPILDIETASKTMAYLSAYSRKRSTNITPLAGIVKCKCGMNARASMVPARLHYARSYGFSCDSYSTYKRLKTLGAIKDKPKCCHNVRISYMTAALETFFEKTDEDSFITAFESALTKQLEDYNSRLSALERLKAARLKHEENKSNIMQTITELARNPEFSGIIKEFAKQIAEIDTALSKVTESIKKVSESVSSSRLILTRLGLSTEHYERPTAKTLESGQVTVTYNNQEYLFESMHAFKVSTVREQMRTDLFDSRIYDNLDSLNNRIAAIRQAIKDEDWAYVNPALAELGVWVIVPFAQTDRDKRRTDIRVTVDFSPMKSAIRKGKGLALVE
ncbi:recombinase family protein [Deinococcus puniceus]|uniref:recombinase family protein n=1 Tax=Deinococcus puniceus TaxID=1182568 RepID=UPI000AC46469|nr:recombinase family protein [Deinococcus puniceus]